MNDMERLHYRNILTKILRQQDDPMIARGMHGGRVHNKEKIIEKINVLLHQLEQCNEPKKMNKQKKMSRRKKEKIHEYIEEPAMEYEMIPERKVRRGRFKKGEERAKIAMAHARAARGRKQLVEKEAKILHDEQAEEKRIDLAIKKAFNKKAFNKKEKKRNKIEDYTKKVKEYVDQIFQEGLREEELRKEAKLRKEEEELRKEEEELRKEAERMKKTSKKMIKDENKRKIGRPRFKPSGK